VARSGECFRGVEVDHQLELGGQLHWQAANHFAAQDTVPMTGLNLNRLYRGYPINLMATGRCESLLLCQWHEAGRCLQAR
jgi:hypothetical protein